MLYQNNRKNGLSTFLEKKFLKYEILPVDNFKKILHFYIFSEYSLYFQLNNLIKIMLYRNINIFYILKLSQH